VFNKFKLDGGYRLGILDQIKNIISKYFIEETGYNPLNTIVYSLIGLGLIFLILYLIGALNKLGQRRWPDSYIEIFPNKPFWIALTPFILLGSVLRALNDSDMVSTRLLETPLIFFLIIVIALSALIVSFITGSQMRRDWRWIFGGIGGIILVIPLGRIIIRIENYIGGVQVFGVWGAWVIGIFAARRFFGETYFSAENIAGLATQMFDASATYVAVTFWNYYEKHVLPAFLFEQFGEWIFFPIKFGLTLAVLLGLDLLLADEDPVLCQWLKITIFIFGFATGTRDVLRLMMMT